MTSRPGLASRPRVTTVATLRASDDDRNAVIAQLRDASVVGRISYDTFVERVGSALAIRHLDELARLVDDVTPPRRSLGQRLGDRLERAVSRASDVEWRLRRAWRAPRLPALRLPALPLRATRLPAGADTLTLGRAPDQDFRLAHHTVSRRHALLRRAANGWEVVDLCSTNGTRVNGWRVVGAHPLRPGDVVSFGEWEMTVD